MAQDKKKSRTGNVVLPDWLGSGQDLFGTIQVIKGKRVKFGFLEIDLNFKFSDTFNYPIIFRLRSIDTEIVADAISFRINGSIDPARRVIEEKVIVPKVCRILKKCDFLGFFADVVHHDVDFAIYLNKTPRRLKDITVYDLNDDQKIVLNEKLVLQIARVLDERGGHP